MIGSSPDYSRTMTREAGGSWRGGVSVRPGSDTHSPESPLFERRTGLGGPTPPGARTPRRATRPLSRASFVNSPG